MSESQQKPDARHLETGHELAPDPELVKEERDAPMLMKSSLDHMSVWQAMRVYKRAVFIALLAAFSASLDGYRECRALITGSLFQEINLNGSIVANLGFIQTFASETNRALAKPVMDSTYVSVWGGLQSTGQFIGQVLLPMASDRFGRKIAFYITWLVLAVSVTIECVVNTWGGWAGAKLLAGMGVGMVQATLPMYIAELSPTQLRGFTINAYTFWFVVGQLMAPVALQRLNVSHPYDFRVAIYTQWGMIGLLVGIFLWIPESPWWLVAHGKVDQARKVLVKIHGGIAEYNVEHEIVSDM